MMQTHGCLIISLDFEMMWGCHDWATTDGYGSTNIRNVREVIDKLLTLFSRYNIHATFATVGLLMCKNRHEALQSIPTLTPTYRNMRMSPYRDDFIYNISNDDFDLFFAQDIINKLKAHRNIEIGTHTFGHYYCWEEGQTTDQFRCDIDKAKEKANYNNIVLKSIVFPKNNVSKDYLDVAASEGIKIYRGNPLRLFNQPRSKILAIIQRLARLIDSYLPLTKNTYNCSDIDMSKSIVNIPASRFLRPYSHALRYLERLKLRRIIREITYAARNGKVYHLWWHPHNFGSNIDKNFEILESILQAYATCAKKYGMKSLTMSELYDKISAGI